MTVCVVVAERQRLVREGLCALLAAGAGCRVLGHAGDGRSVLTLIRRHQPQILLAEAALLHSKCGTLVGRAQATCPQMRIIALTDGISAAGARRVPIPGAHACLPKASSSQALHRAIGRALATPLPRPSAGDPGTRRPSAGHRPLLTGRECEVLQLVSEGLTTRQIAQRLGLSVKTVDTHRQHIMTKLRIRSIAGLTRFALREGISSLES